MDMAELRQEGEPFDVVMNRFLAWCGEEEYCFCTWGSMDLTELQRNMAYHKLPNPFPRPFYIWISRSFTAFSTGTEKTRYPLIWRYRFREWRRRGLFTALDDAYYTGRILSVLDMETFGTYVSVDYYGLPRNKAEEYRLHFPEYSKYVSREFDSREDILKDKDITDMKCVKCSRMLRKKIRWFPYGQRFYFCLAVCPEHGYVKGKIRVKSQRMTAFML